MLSRTTPAMKIAPSLLSADFARIREQIELVERGGADYLHLDIMDGRFVPNITWGPKIIKDLRPLSKLVFDTHLMIVEPERYVADFAAAGSDIITVHWEATVHANRLIHQIKELGVRAGLSVNPATSLSVLDEILPYIDLLLIMSVNPGFGGQSYIPTSTAKIAAAREIINRRGLAHRARGRWRRASRQCRRSRARWGRYGRHGGGYLRHAATRRDRGARPCAMRALTPQLTEDQLVASISRCARRAAAQAPDRHRRRRRGLEGGAVASQPDHNRHAGRWRAFHARVDDRRRARA